MKRPASASGAWTGPLGVLVGTAALFLFRDWAAPNYVRTTTVMAAAAAAMVLLEIVAYRALDKAGMAGAGRAANWHRIVQKLVGLWVTLGIIGGAYWLFPLYADKFYDPFRDALLLTLPFIVALSVPYIWFVDSRQAEPEDAYVDIARLLGGTVPAEWRPLSGHVRSWAVKAFFLPLMFIFLNGDLAGFWSIKSFPELLTFKAIFDNGYNLLYLFDVTLAAIGYSMTFRLLGTHIRSAEPTLWGWVVCLACYPPFWEITNRYVGYDQDNVYWGGIFNNNPVLYAIWGSIILLCIAIYAWATIAFGLRFSNLTHRGIITHGPYRWVKHPAYLSKNISWWMISMPFIAGTGDWSMALRSTILLGGMNLIYFLRAKTEERHLSADPAYREYAQFIAEHGLLAKLTRRRKAAVIPPAGSTAPLDEAG